MPLAPITPELVKDKIIVVRVDFNVPITNGKVSEKTRIKASIPTLKLLADNGAKRVHILSHLGRPKGEYDKKYSLEVVMKDLQKFLGEEVEFRQDFTSGEARFQLHENVRFHPGEKKNDPDLIQQMLKGMTPDLFINDGFAVSHRAHASVIGIGSFVPSYGGLLVQKEIQSLSPFLTKDKVNGLTVIIGGAKMETKVPVLRHFAAIADNILLGGGIANTFLSAQGFDVGQSLYEPDAINIAREILSIAEHNQTGIHLPVDVVCADEIDATQAIDIPVEDIAGDMKVFDLGAQSINSYQEVIQHSKTIIWNGPVGLFEKAPFEAGTREVLKAVAAQRSAETILGGGDTLEALKKYGVDQDIFSHVSTGGGSMLEFLEGKNLPGIDILQ